MPEINIPFPGFYESHLSDAVDRELEQFVENRCEDQAADWPEPLRLSESDMGELSWRPMDHSAAYCDIARDYVTEFDAWAGEVLGESRGFKFSLMTSPREYNFETDRLFVTCSAAFIKRLWKMSKADEHETLRRYIADRFTSRSGFISHYRNDLESWGALDNWDYNQLGTLLLACLELSGADDDGMSRYWVYESAYQYFDAAFDFDRFDSDVAEKRAELLQAWLNEDPEACAQWRAHNAEQCAALVAADLSLFENCEWPEAQAVGAWYRCNKTPDMFEGVGL